MVTSTNHGYLDTVIMENYKMVNSVADFMTRSLHNVNFD